MGRQLRVPDFLYTYLSAHFPPTQIKAFSGGWMQCTGKHCCQSKNHAEILASEKSASTES